MTIKKANIFIPKIIFILLTLFFIFVATMSIIMLIRINKSDNFNNRLYVDCKKFKNDPEECVKHSNCVWNSQLNDNEKCAMSGEVSGNYGNNNVIN